MKEQKEITGIRNHFTVVLENTWGALIILAAVVLNIIDDAEVDVSKLLANWDFKKMLFVAAVFVYLIWYFAIQILRWYKTTITVKDGTVVIERNTLNRLSNTISVNNISNVNLEQNIFEMICGTYKLKIDTNSSSTADVCDVKIILKKDVAYAVKNLITQMMKEENAENPEAALRQENDSDYPGGADASSVNLEYYEAKEEFDIVYSNRELFVNAAINANILSVIVILCTAIITLGGMSGSGGILVQIGVTMVMVLWVAWQLLSLWFRTYGFRCKRRGDKIYIKAGLFTQRHYTIPISKINAVQIKYSFIGRIMKHPYIKVVNIGGEEEETSGTMILLSAPYEVLKEQIKILIPEMKLPEQSHLSGQPKKVMVKNLLCTIAVFAGVIAAFRIAGSYVMPDITDAPENVMKWMTWALALIMGLWMIRGICKSITAGIEANEDYLISEEGCFGKNVIMIPYGKIQNLSFHQGPLERLLNVENLNITILADMLNSNIGISAFEVADFEELKEQLRKTY